MRQVEKHHIINSLVVTNAALSINKISTMLKRMIHRSLCQP
ncbi:hypothetical protein C3B55_00933 [Candidatus Pseudomonas adelgestsugas]|uniref:Uncharacterized protein n=1 Tax=Candidatus Pseudomonas adelgestsugas TaxID=1302376 RepID=A0ABX5RAI0_9PSED|nr:hypothetical protein C3B55_00933 [Candidatus Pseudomonas adelgestsugas]